MLNFITLLQKFAELSYHIEDSKYLPNSPVRGNITRIL